MKKLQKMKNKDYEINKLYNLYFMNILSYKKKSLQNLLNLFLL